MSNTSIRGWSMRGSSGGGRGRGVGVPGCNLIKRKKIFTKDILVIDQILGSKGEVSPELFDVFGLIRKEF